MKGIYPDAIVQDGIVSCTQTGVELPSYEGLVLYKAVHTWCILFTQIDPNEGRIFMFVHWGSQLNSGEIELFSKG